MEAQFLADLFAAEAIEEAAAKTAAMRALAALLCYRVQIERESAAAMRDLNSLSCRRLAPPLPARRDEPEPLQPTNDALVREESGHLPNRHERRALAAIERRRIN
jgi:hypothetical protein